MAPVSLLEGGHRERNSALDASRNDAAVLGWADMPIHIMLSGPGAGSAGTKRQQRWVRIMGNLRE
jgi:hypothetical protein